LLFNWIWDAFLFLAYVFPCYSFVSKQHLNTSLAAFVDKNPASATSSQTISHSLLLILAEQAAATQPIAKAAKELLIC